MTERPFTPPGDDDLEAALRARRRLLPRFDTDLDDEPSPELDRRVLSRAREALRREAPPERHYRSPRWGAPVAIAATVLLSLGLVLQMDPARNDAVLDTGAATTAMTDVAGPASREAAQSAAPAAPTPPPAAAPAVAATRTAPTPPPVAASPAPAPPAAAMPAAPAESLVRSRVSAGAGLATDRAAKSAPPTGAAASSVAAVADFGAVAEVATTDAASAQADPQRWLAAIEQLRAAGEVDAARRELAAFRRRHPDLPLPDALDALR